jgi:Fe-Mn family superoxide dismutase
MKFELPKLPYELDALEPFISNKTLEFHYGKHHQTYVTNLNNLISGTKFENAELETIIKEAEGAIFNNAAQVWNHTFYFMSFNKGNGNIPKSKIAYLINSSFGTFEAFKDEFTKSSIGLFGSGWTWLVKNKAGLLEITQENNAGNPLRKELKPIMTCDVWEHAYYLDYQNRRADYINAFWNIIDWDIIEKRL